MAKEEVEGDLLEEEEDPLQGGEDPLQVEEDPLQVEEDPLQVGGAHLLVGGGNVRHREVEARYGNMRESGEAEVQEGRRQRGKKEKKEAKNRGVGGGAGWFGRVTGWLVKGVKWNGGAGKGEGVGG